MDISATGSILNIIAPTLKGIAPNISMEIMAAGRVLPAEDMNTGMLVAELLNGAAQGVATFNAGVLHKENIVIADPTVVVLDAAGLNTVVAAGIDKEWRC